jgi:hypothetical protein
MGAKPPHLGEFPPSKKGYNRLARPARLPVRTALARMTLSGWWPGGRHSGGRAVWRVRCGLGGLDMKGLVNIYTKACITKKDQRGKTVTDMEKLSRHNSIVAFSDDSNPVLHSRLIL